MKTFLRINGIGILLALFFFVWTTLMLNIYRINRVFGVDITVINLITITYIIVVLIAIPFLLKQFLRTFFQHRNKKIVYILVVVWFPYFKIMEGIFYNLFPFVNRGDLPAQVLGLALLLAYILYPVYLFFVILAQKNG